ncbi:MAG: HD domain-containing protein [Melioribacteraceae bacterium]|nr:HD domain-containing protein [Melioribacteraceae bacterium]
MSTNNILEITELFVRKIFEKNSNPDHVYHNLTHTCEVVEAAAKIASGVGLKDDELEMLLIAAWFHDIGYTQSSEEHEELSAEAAEKFLQEQNYDPGRMKIILSAIKATKLPQIPSDIVGEILCDADLSHLSGNDFFEKGELLRNEFEKRYHRKYSDEEWLKNSYDFMMGHEYFTRYALKIFVPGKEKNLLELRKILKG